MRRFGVLILVAAGACVLSAAASAHARLVRSNPPDRAVLAQAPSSVRLDFDETVQLVGGIEAVRNGGRSVLKGAPRRAGAREVVIPLRPQLRDGDYSVRWQVLSDDGHIVVGVLAFAVGAGRAPPVSALSAGGGPGARELISRWLFLFGLLVASGSAVFSLGIWRRATRREEPGAVTAVLFAGFLFAFLGASGLIHHHQAATRSSVAYEVAALLGLLGATFAALGLFERRFRLLGSIVALALLPIPTVAGHALDPSRLRVLNAIADLAHVTSAAVWTGGLLALALALRRRVDGAVVRRFSALALVSVAVLSGTGLARALYELSSFNQLWHTGYGQAIVVKTALLALLVGLGWINRSKLVPAFDRSEAARGRLRESLRAEVLLLAGVVVAVAFLTDLPPGRKIAVAARIAIPAPGAPPPLPPAGSVLFAHEDGELAVVLAASPTRRPTLEALVVGPDARGVTLPGVSFVIGGRRLRTIGCGSGCYAAAARRSVRALTLDLGASSVRFTLPQSWPPARGEALVARATGTFSRLRSLLFRERLASGPRNVVTSSWSEEAPNRFTYAIPGAANAIVVGARRWDRTSPGGTWTLSAQTPLPQPRAPWSIAPTTNAYLVGGDSRVAVATFFSPTIRAWFRVAIERASGRTLDLHMIAAAHFMHDRYGPFNQPLRIRPPR